MAWKVKPGDIVAINDVLVEIETAKSIVELPSPYAGLVAELLVEAGQTVEVGTPIIRIGSEQPLPMYGAPLRDPDEPADSAPASAAPGPLVGSGPKAGRGETAPAQGRGSGRFRRHYAGRNDDGGARRGRVWNRSCVVVGGRGENGPDAGQAAGTQGSQGSGHQSGRRLAHRSAAAR